MRNSFWNNAEDNTVGTTVGITIEQTTHRNKYRKPQDRTTKRNWRKKLYESRHNKRTTTGKHYRETQLEENVEQATGTRKETL